MSTRSRHLVPPLLLVLATTLPVASAGGQSASLLVAGARVRVQAAPSAGWQAGRLVSADSGSVVLGRNEKIANAGRMVTIVLHDTIPASSVRMIEVDRGRPGAGGRAALGFALGAVAGLGAGVAMAYAMDDGTDYSGLGMLIIGAPILGVTVGTAGAIIGWKSAPVRWERVERPLRIAASPR